jgi:hypothetical protein
MTPYWYVYFDDNFVPYYVGEGSRARFLECHPERDHGTGIPVSPPERILRVEVASKELAQAMETFLIVNIGRRTENAGIHTVKFGPLMNRSDGVGCKNPTPATHKVLCDKYRATFTGVTPSNNDALHEGNRGNTYALGKHWSGCRKIPLTSEHQREAGHIRWHVNRGIKKEGCVLCQ